MWGRAYLHLNMHCMSTRSSGENRTVKLVSCPTGITPLVGVTENGEISFSTPQLKPASDLSSTASLIVFPF